MNEFSVLYDTDPLKIQTDFYFLFRPSPKQGENFMAIANSFSVRA